METERREAPLNSAVHANSSKGTLEKVLNVLLLHTGELKPNRTAKVAKMIQVTLTLMGKRNLICVRI